MTDLIRPGPASLPEGTCPGGVVIQVYSVPAGALLLTQRLSAGADIEMAAASAVEQVSALPFGAGVCLVSFDGDTGERYTADHWTMKP